MKQGQASHSGMASTKVEPKSNAVSPTSVATMGIMRGNHSDESNMPFTSIPLYQGRGLEAPMVGTQQHHSGSQGKHK